jgi:hypothetical protein
VQSLFTEAGTVQQLTYKTEQCLWSSNSRTEVGIEVIWRGSMQSLFTEAGTVQQLTYRAEQCLWSSNSCIEVGIEVIWPPPPGQKIEIITDPMPCSLAESYQRFNKTCASIFKLGSKYLRQDCTFFVRLYCVIFEKTGVSTDSRLQILVA